MYFIGTGKLEHGFRISVVLDEDSRFILGYAIGKFHKTRLKKSEKYSELESAAINSANKTVLEYGLESINDPQKSVKVSSFFSSLKTECIDGLYCETEDELQQFIGAYLKYYNFERLHSGLKYKTPYEVLQSKIIKQPTMP